jgi:branched-chain amino acid transport system permease protein
VRTKVAVFALSAGIAGLGGALLGGLRQSVDTTTFGFTTGLVLFVLAIVGGLGAPGGSVIAAVGVVVLPLTSTWPVLSSVSWWPNLIAITPALLGIQLGREPNGLRQRLHRDFLPLWRDPAAVAGVLVGAATLYLLVRAELISGWLFAVALALVFVAANAWADRAGLTGRPEADEREPAASLEWAGIDRPFTPEQLLELERRMPIREVGRAPA